MFGDELTRKVRKYNESARNIKKKKEEIDRKASEDKEKLDIILKTSLGDIESYANLIEKYSIFRSCDILPVLADLLTFYNGEKYDYYIGEEGFIITSELNKGLDIFGFAKKQDLFKDLNTISKLTIDDLVLPFNLKMVGDESCVEFYHYNCVSKLLKYYIEVETQDEKIIKDFIDYIIEYSLNNIGIDINKVKLNHLEKEYLKKKKGEIIAAYKTLDMNEQRELNDKQARRRLMLDNLK